VSDGFLWFFRTAQVSLLLHLIKGCQKILCAGQTTLTATGLKAGIFARDGICEGRNLQFAEVAKLGRRTGRPFQCRE
jgi:hypothetical protein